MAEGTGRGEAARRIAFNLFQPPQAAVQNRKIQTEDRATALSVHAVLLDGVTIAATLLFGRLSEVSLSVAFLLGVGLCLGAWGCFAGTQKEYR